MRTEYRRHAAVIRLYGELEQSCEPAFGDELERALDNEAWIVIVDLRDLTFIDATGLRLLTELDRLARSDALELTILCNSGAVRRIIEEAHLDEVLPVVDPGEATALPAEPRAGARCKFALR
jgi:anti-anti-sigma factor